MCVCVWGGSLAGDRKCMNFDRKDKMNRREEGWREGAEKESEVRERLKEAR